MLDQILQSERVLVVLSSFFAVATSRRHIFPRLFGSSIAARFGDDDKLRDRYSNVLFSLLWYLFAVAVQAREILPRAAHWYAHGFHDRAIIGAGGHVPYYLLLVMMGYYMDEVVHLFFEPHRRSDHRQLAAHHFVTLFALWACQVYGYGTGTLCSVFVHDVCDIFIGAAKLFNYERRSALCTAAFACLVPVWIVGRLAIYPHIVYRMWAFHPDSLMVHLLYAFPAAIYLLDVYWFWLIVRVALNGLRKDVSDDSSDEDPKKEN